MKAKIKTLININNSTKAYQFYQFLRLISLVFISFLLVKTSYSTEETSGFELFLFIANIGSFFLIMGFGNSILSYYPKLKKEDKSTFFKSIFILIQLLGLVIAVTAYFTKGFHLIQENTIFNPNILLLLSLYILFYFPTFLIEIFYILKKDYNSLLKYGIVLFFAQFVFILLAIILFRDIYYILLSLTIWIFLRWIWSIKVVFYNQNGKILNLTNIKLFSIFSIPIILHILLSNGMDYIDGVLINEFFTEDKFAIYRYGAREFPIILIIIGAMRSVMIPQATEDVDLAASLIKQKTRNIILYFFPIGILLMVFSKYIFVFFYSDDYVYSAVLFNIYLLIIASRILLPEVFIYAKQKSIILMYVSFAELMLNIALSIVLMNYYGMAGIAIATVISFFASKLFLVLYTNRILNMPLNKYLDIKLYSFMTLVLFIVFYLTISV